MLSFIQIVCKCVCVCVCVCVCDEKRDKKIKELISPFYYTLDLNGSLKIKVSQERDGKYSHKRVIFEMSSLKIVYFVLLK